jgi:tRNA A37 threonylcarbamoyladenosine biosynthesis protein TsaE
LGFKEIIKNPKNIIAIEWADKIKKILLKKVIKIKFKILEKKEREILIKWQKDC